MNSKGILSFFLLGFVACSAFGAEVEQTIDQLVPRLGSTNVGERYDAQMDLQALAVKSARPGAKAERAEWSKVLAAKATDTSIPQPARVWFVRQLEYIGDAEAVTSLALLLNGQDAELKECARRALEKNPAPAAGEVLRTALEQGGDTSWKIGLIQSIGERRDAKAVSLVKPYLGDKQLGGASASSLAKIANNESVEALWKSYESGNPLAASALILAGAHLIQADERAKAEKIFLRLYEVGGAATPAPWVGKDSAAATRLRSAALVGLAKANPKEARKYITAELQSPDPHLQYAAVTAAGVAYGKDRFTSELAPLFPKMPATAKVYALRQMDPSAEAQVISLTEDPNEGVQIAAFEALGRIGGAASVPVLVKAAATNTPVQKVATAALASAHSSDADVAIEKAAEQGDAVARAVAIRALAARHDIRSVPDLVKYAGESDGKVSEAALFALGKLGSDNEVEILATLAAAGKTPGSDAALQGVLSRVKDKDTATKKLVAMVPSASPQQVGFLFETLVALGGPEALARVTNSVTSDNAEVKDAAIRALANWPDFAATGPLLAIAADPNAKRVHQVLAIQGVVRLVKSSENERAEARLGAALQAMSAATRDEEKKLVISSFASVPDVKAAEAIKPYLSDAKFEPEAGIAGVALAESLRKTDKAAAKDLAQAVKQANVSDEVTRKADALLRRN